MQSSHFNMHCVWVLALLLLLLLPSANSSTRPPQLPIVYKHGLPAALFDATAGCAAVASTELKRRQYGQSFWMAMDGEGGEAQIVIEQAILELHKRVIKPLWAQLVPTGSHIVGAEWWTHSRPLQQGVCCLLQVHATLSTLLSPAKQACTFTPTVMKSAILWMAPGCTPLCLLCCTRTMLAVAP